jgi:hypothetical protein
MAGGEIERKPVVGGTEMPHHVRAPPGKPGEDRSREGCAKDTQGNNGMPPWSDRASQ